jgi:cysteine desulfurase
MRVYLDHNATTPVRAEVAEAMTRILREVHGNPSSVHAEGAAARREVERAREQVASLLGFAPAEIVFTAGATEANNTALLSVAASRPDGRRHVVATAVVHPSVEAALERLEARGHPVTRVSVDRSGRVVPEAVAAALRDDTALVSVIFANNETGVIQPLEEIAALAHARGAWVHTDATQAVGKHPLDATAGCDLLSMSAHKLGGPKGVGCLAVRAALPFAPYSHGGPQERRRRGGTENTAGVVGLGVACALARDEGEARRAEYAQLRDRLWEGIAAKVPGVVRNGDPEHVLCNTLNVSFLDTPGEVVLQALDLEGVAASAGAACASGSITPSHVLVAMGLSPEEARGTLRLSVGHGNDASQVDRVLALLPDLVERARAARGS